MSIITGIHDVSLGRGLVGFTTAAIIIYITQFVVDGYYISITSSLIAAAIYGVIDSMLINKNNCHNIFVAVFILLNYYMSISI